MFKPFLILNLITLKFYNMNKQIQKSQISIGLLMMCVIAMQALLFSSLFSSCKKNAPPVEIYYTVTFNSQGGSAVSPITEVKPGSAITLPASPTKAGSTFDGWCTDKEGKYLFLPTTPINSDFTLYAKWGEQFYTVTFDSKGGSAVNPITGVKPGSTITLPASPTKAGFAFDGWCTDKEGKSSFSPTTPINSDLTLYAKWTTAKTIMRLVSTSFTNGDEIPPKHIYPYDGQAEYLNVSPQLSWGGAPKGTASFLIIMEDFVGAFANWHVYNIPADKLSLAENDSWLSTYDNNTLGYHGPDSRYRIDIKKFTYIITIFALDLPPNYFKGNIPIPLFIRLTKRKLGSHVLATASIKVVFTVK